MPYHFLVNPFMSFPAAGGSAPTIVTSTSSNGNGGSPISISLPASLVSGNQLFVFVGCAGNETLSTPTGWSLTAHATSGGTAGSDRRLYCWQKTSDGTEGATISSTVTGTSGSWASTAYQINGYNSVTAATTTGTSTNPDPPNCNPGTSADTLWIPAAVKRESVTAVGAPSGYANLLATRNLNMSGMAADKTATASSDDPGVFTTFSVSDNYAAITLGIR